MGSVFQPPYVQQNMPYVPQQNTYMPQQVPYVQYSPGPYYVAKNKHSIENGLAIGGRFYSVMGAIIGVIIMIFLIIVGVTKLHDKHTASASMTVTSVNLCSGQTITDGQGNTTSNYMCDILVKFTAGGKTHASSKPITVTVPAPVTVNSKITLRYNPKNPNDIVQEPPPKATGRLMIGGGLLLGALSVGAAVLTFKSKGFAEFEGAAGLISTFNHN